MAYAKRQRLEKQEEFLLIYINNIIRLNISSLKELEKLEKEEALEKEHVDAATAAPSDPRGSLILPRSKTCSPAGLLLRLS